MCNDNDGVVLFCALIVGIGYMYGSFVTCALHGPVFPSDAQRANVMRYRFNGGLHLMNRSCPGWREAHAPHLQWPLIGRDDLSISLDGC